MTPGFIGILMISVFRLTSVYKRGLDKYIYI